MLITQGVWNAFDDLLCIVSGGWTTPKPNKTYIFTYYVDEDGFVHHNREIVTTHYLHSDVKEVLEETLRNSLVRYLDKKNILHDLEEWR